MATFYVVTREIVEKTICIEVDTDNKLEAKKAIASTPGLVPCVVFYCSNYSCFFSFSRLLAIPTTYRWIPSP